MFDQIVYVSWDKEKRGSWEIILFSIYFKLHEAPYEHLEFPGEKIKVEIILRDPEDLREQSLSTLQTTIFCKSKEYLFYDLLTSDLETILYLLNKAKDIMKKHEEACHEKY